MKDNRYTWAVEDIYSEIKAFDSDYDKVKSQLDFSEFKGKLHLKQQFLACMQKQKDVLRVLEKLSLYAFLNHDKDTRDSFYDGLNTKITSLYSDYATLTAYIEPELTSLDEEILKSFIADEQFSEYDYMLKRILDEKAHVLSEKEETLLANFSESFSAFREIFSKIDNADLKFGNVMVDGKRHPLSHGTYGLIMHSDDRQLRKKAFKKYYKGYIDFINTISSVYYANVKKNVSIAKARNYKSALSMALSGEDVEDVVYYNLLDSVNSALPLLHRYMTVKKKGLKLDEMHMYDVYVDQNNSSQLKYTYDQAYKVVVEGLSVLGEEYVSLLNKAHDERWIDVYETEGKRSGAYSAGVFDTHPYVLLNYQQTTHDVFTIAHEMGHSIHTYFSNKTQPYFKADYKIFVAEVASTVNEVLLVKHLLKTAKGNCMKKYLLCYLMEMIRTTLFRQTQFSEFEEFSHSQVEKGEPLTKDVMCEKYLSLNKKYYGEAVVSDEEIKYEWARIPHFYRAFYVYKYSTGIISALTIADRILTEGESAINDYFKFLSSGGSDSPVKLLKIAGVDLTDKNTFARAFKVFEDALEQYEKL